MRRITSFLAVALVAGLSLSSFAAGPQLFKPAQASAKRMLADTTSPATAVQINTEGMKQLRHLDEFELNLPGTNPQPYVVEMVQSQGDGITSWIGSHRDLGRSYRTIITSGPTGSFGAITTPEGEFRIVPGQGNDWLLAEPEFNPTPSGRNTDVLLPPPQPKALRMSQETPETTLAIPGVTVPSREKGAKLGAGPSPQVIVDILFVYTSQFGANLGPDLQTRLAFLVTRANDAYALSDVSITMRMVGSMQVTYGGSDSGTALNEITPGCGFCGPFNTASFSGVEAMRTSVGADVVAFFMDGSDFGGNGIAWLGSATPSANFMYSVTQGCVRGCESVFIHEVGHNMGNNHDPATVRWQDGGTPTLDPGPSTAFSFGYAFCKSGALNCNPNLANGTGGSCSSNPECSTPADASNFRELMAYFFSSGSGSRQLYRFSNPNHTDCKSPGGDGVNRACGVAGLSDTAQVMNNNRTAVSGIKASMIGSTLQFTTTAVAASEGTSAQLLVSRTGGSAGAVSVNYSMADGTAVAPGDYTSSSSTLNWGSGVTTSQQINIPIMADGQSENPEAFTVSLWNAAPSGANGASLGANSTATVLIPAPYPPGGTFPTGYVTPAGSQGAWTVVTDQAFEGANSLGSAKVLGAGPNPGDTFDNSDLTFTGQFTAGTVAFAYRISSYQSGISNFTFAVDGVTALTEPGGESGWKIGAVPITAGTHTLRWRFSNSLTFPCNAVNPPATGGANCADRAWIDVVALPLALGISMATSSQSVSESAGNIMLSVNRSGDVSSAASVNYATSNGTAIAGTHYTTTSGTLNWAAGDSTSQMITVPIADNASTNAARTFTVTLSGATGSILSSPSATVVSITDDETSLQFSSATATITEGPSPLNLTVTRTGSTSQPVSIDWSTADGTAVAGTDFGTLGNATPVSGTLTWGADDSSSKTVTVPIINDSLAQTVRNFTVNLSSPSGTGALVGTPATVTVTMNDDEASLSFSTPTVTVNESGTIMNLAVNRSGSMANAITVTWTTSNGTALAGSDFGTSGSGTQRTGMLSWAAGDASVRNVSIGPGFANIPILTDAVVEGSETFNITLSAPTGGAVLGAVPVATVTITDDDSTIEFSTPTVSVSEAGPNVTLTVTRTGSMTTAASVTYSTASGTATAGSDFTTTTGTISWAAGDGSPKTITLGPSAAAAPYIAIINDAVIEGPETFAVTLSAPVGAGLGSNTSATVTIDSDDRGVAMGATTLPVAESVGNAQVMVMRTGPSTGAVSVNYATANGTATAPANYTTTTGTLNWADGDGAPKTINVPIVNDTATNAARTFTVTLSGAAGASLGAPATTTVTISDDDNLVQLSAATATVTEGLTPLTLTVTRTGVTTAAASVNWSTVDGTATAGTDFGASGNATPVSGTLNWAAGDATSKTITVPLINDAVVEPTKNFSVMLSSPSGTGTSIGAIGSATVTLLDDEAAINFASPTITVLENGASMNIAVNRSGASTGAVSVTWTTSDGTAVAGSDFGTAGSTAQKSGTLSWAAGDATPKNISIGPSFANIMIINDNVVEPSKTFTVTLSAPTGGAVLGPTSSTAVTINDDDSTIQFSPATVNVSESGPNVTLTVTRTGSGPLAASVPFTTASGTALVGQDYGTLGSGVQASGTISWAAGDATPKTITLGPVAAAAPYIPIINDATIEGPEAFTIVLGAPTGATLGAATTATVTIDSDDVGITMAAPTLTVTESVGTAAVSVVRAGPATAAVSVNYTTVNGTATSPAHYTTTTGTLNWAAGDGTPKTINVPIIDNAVVNTARSFNVTLSGPVGATLGTPATTAVTINDDDNTLQFTAATATLTEGPTPLTLTVTRTGGASGAASVNWSTVDGTATAGTDFGASGVPTPVTGTLNWAAGDTAGKTITVPIINDAIVEPTKNFNVTLSSPTGAGAAIGAIGTVAVTLLDDEASINFASPTATVVEGGAAINVQVTRSGAATGAVSVTWTTANGTAMAGSDFGTSGSGVQKTGVVSWAAGDSAPKNITVGTAFANIPVINDTVIEPSETFTITLSAPTGGAVLGPTSSTTVTIDDNDSTLQFSTPTVNVGESGTNATLTVTRAGSTAAAASVTFSTANGTALAGSDFTTTSGTLSWAAGDGAAKTITVGPTAAPAPHIAVLNDAVIEGPETFTVTLSAPVGAALGATPTATVTIDSDDVGIAMAAATLSVAESVGTATVNVVRTGPATGAISVNYTTANGTATAPANYTTTTGTLNWAAGDSAPKPISIPIIDNAVVNTARTFNVTLSGPVGAALGTPVTTTVTINDDDNTLQFNAATATVTEGAGVLNLTVTRTGGAGAVASIDWSTADGTALAGTDFGTLGNTAAVTGTLNWAAGDAASKTVVIPILDDAIVEGAKTFTVTLSSPTGAGAAIGAIPTATVTLNDNDSGVVFMKDSYFVNENGATIGIMVSRIGPVTSAASVTWTTANGTAISGTDFGVAGNATPRTGVLNWAAGDGTAKQFSIPILDDALSQGNLTFTVGLSAPSAGLVVGTPGTTTVTIVDNESAAPSTVQFSAVKYVAMEGAAPAILTVTRSGDPSIPVTVNYTTNPGTALAFSDYTTTTGTLTWAAGDSGSKIITVPIMNDAIAESPEQFAVTLSAPSPGLGLGVPATTTVLILDDDEVWPPQGAIPAGWVIPAASTTGWHVSNDAGAFEGVFQLRTDTVYDGETAGIEVTGTYQAGTVTFRYKVSSELNFDYLRFFIDGVEVAKFSGTAVTGWTLYSVPVTAGPHTFRWVYEKDVNGTVGSDAAWIDAVTLPPP